MPDHSHFVNVDYIKLGNLTIDANPQLPPSLARGGVNEIVDMLNLGAVSELVEIIRQMHPNVSVLAAMVLSGVDIVLSGDNYVLNDGAGDVQKYLNTTEYSDTVAGYHEHGSYTLTEDHNHVHVRVEIHRSYAGAVVYGAYQINGEGWNKFGYTASESYVSHEIDLGSLPSGTVIHTGLWRYDYGSDPVYLRNQEVYINDAVISGDITTDALAANAAVLSFFSHLKGKFSNGGSTAADPITVEIYGDGDSYALALNGTTKLKIDPTDPIIGLYRTDDSVVAKSDAQTDWMLDDNSTNGAFPAKTTSTHETILAEEIGCAAVVMVEKSVNGAFTDTEILMEDDDYTIDYSTRTVTKISLTTSAASDIVISQSKLRITWIVDVENIDGTANTALKMKIYLNRTDTTEASPEIQPIDLGTGKYAEMKYICG